MAAQTFNRWGHLGVWERLLEVAQEGGVELGMVFLDGTVMGWTPPDGIDVPRWRC